MRPSMRQLLVLVLLGSALWGPLVEAGPAHTEPTRSAAAAPAVHTPLHAKRTTTAHVKVVSKAHLGSCDLPDHERCGRAGKACHHSGAGQHFALPVQLLAVVPGQAASRLPPPLKSNAGGLDPAPEPKPPKA